MTVAEFDRGLHFICMSAEDFGYYRETGLHQEQKERRAEHERLLAAYGAKCAKLDEARADRAELLELLEKAFEGYIDVNTAFYEDVQAALVKYDA